MIRLAHYSLDTFEGYWSHFPIKVQFSSPWGLMLMISNAKGISQIEFLDSPLPDIPFVGRHISPAYRENFQSYPDNGIGGFDIFDNMQNAINYLNGEKVQDDIFLYPSCTDFQFTVYQALLNIPEGTTANYKDVSASIGKPPATRAVATAIGLNKVAVLIPCHRVVPASGGYGKYRWRSGRKRAIITYEKQRARH
ncbi:MAG: methylated-DNA--[protein]-cysteine S-methyltransferase [Muribaculaceae bacterium]|nr:methylated-DNA--[protein]-cysteine S-methyltransferase [Muribaculaceae bacterium]